jgi:hypothetical protein
MINLFNESLQHFGYDFILKKRLLKRLWGILILEIQNAEQFFKKYDESFKAWEKFQAATEKHYETMKSIFQSVFKEARPLETDLDSQSLGRRLAGWLLLYMGDLSRYKAKAFSEKK